MKQFKLAIIGAGLRGKGLYRDVIFHREYVTIVGVCDRYEDKASELADLVVEKTGKVRPAVYTDYLSCLEQSKPDAILIATSWDEQLHIAIKAMEMGISVACEVGGAYSIESLWEVVRTYERTKTPIMLMENCCYGRIELLALNMKRLGVLGTIVHCEGGYCHDLRKQVCNGESLRHYRLQQYIHRNTENYPTHEIGPIAKLLNINCGNRFVSLVSMGNRPVGMEEYVKEHHIKSLYGVPFHQSDVVTTMIKCQNGEQVTIKLSTGVPRYYSRSFLVQGTKGLICEENQSVYLEKDWDEEQWEWKDNFNNIDQYYKLYDHKRWADYQPGESGHGGIDDLEFDAFFEALDQGKPMPIDVYDLAAWKCISVLSEQSLATGLPVAFPDFTDGKWILRKNEFEI